MAPALAHAGPCCAGNENYEEDSQFYFGGELNYTTAKAARAAFAPSSAVRLFYGYRMTQRVAIEFAYLDLGYYNDPVTRKTTSISGQSIVLLGKIPLDRDAKYSAYGRVGLSFSDVNIAGIGRSRHNDMTFGAGIEVNLDEEEHLWYARFGIDRYNTGCLTVVMPPNFATPDSITTVGVAIVHNL